MHQSDVLFRAFMEHSPLLAFIKDPHGRIHYGNPAWAKSLQQSLDELIGRQEADIYPANMLALIGAGDAEVIQQQQATDVTRQLAGTAEWWRIIKFPLHSPDNDCLIGGFAWNVTDNVTTHQALAESEAYAKAVLDTAVDAIISINMTGYIESFNAAACRMFGYEASEVIGKKIEILMPEPYHSQHDGYMQRYLHGGEKRIIGIGREVTALRNNGETFPINLAVSEVRVNGKRSFTGVIRDLSAEKRREVELKLQAEEAKQQRDRVTHMTRVSTLGEMAAGIAHEINQPLTAISNYAQACHRLLKAGKIQETAIQDALHKISTQALRAGEVIRKMRNLVRHAVNEHRPEDINEVIHDCVALADYEGRLLNIGLQLELSPNLPMVHIDRVQIQQVILNLIRNAQDAMHGLHTDKPVTLASRRFDRNFIEVVVKDQGSGISKNDEQHLFQHFHTTKTGGMGIGLAVSRSIIESHGGNLWFTRNEHAGVSFHFTIATMTDQSE